jgi:Na+-driven multidrug efflux pump
MVVYSYVVVIFVVVSAPKIIDILYGVQYSESAEILKIHAFGLIFMATGVVRNRWLISENKTKFLMIATSLGALTNVAFNLVLIPGHQSVGAAWATVISYAVSTYLSCILIRENRVVFHVLSKGYVVPFRMRGLLGFCRKILLEKKILTSK